MMVLRTAVLGCALAMIAVPLAAKDDVKRPAALAKLFDCRGIADDAQRLACYDSGLASLEQAQAAGDVTIVDREDVRRTRRGLFGFSLADLPIFGRRDGKETDERDEIKEITAKITAVSQNAEGGWILTLEDGARWEQTGTMVFGRSPRRGATATIKRAALGSYKMSVDGSPSVKARRVR